VVAGAQGDRERAQARLDEAVRVATAQGAHRVADRAAALAGELVDPVSARSLGRA
jgi:hypothetical protein